MMTKGLHYSLYVVDTLDMAAWCVQQANQPQADGQQEKLLHYAAMYQNNALDMAKYEARRGPVFERLLPRLPPDQVRFLQEIYERWRRYLAAVGYELPPIDFKT